MATVTAPWRLLGVPDHRGPALSAYLEQSGVSAEDIPLCLDVAQALGIDRYTSLYRAVARNALYQEAFYAALLFPERRPVILNMLLDAGLPEPVGQALDAWEAAHTKALAAIDWAAFNIVVILGDGVVSSPHTYFLSSLFLAQRIKRIAPGTQVGMAGTDFSGRIGSSAVQAFPWVDFVINGEPERPVAMLAMHLGDPTWPDIPGVIRRRPDGTVPLTRAEQVADLDALPIPRFHRFMAHPVTRTQATPVVLVVEGARGCWWDRSHVDPRLSCLFCNINTDVDGYRAKSIPRLIDEIRTQTRAYGLTLIALSDTITRPKDARAFFDALADADLKLTVTQVEAHVSLPFDTYAAMARAGVVMVQLGVEALVPSLLAKMNKGITFARTIVALRTCRELNLWVHANLLVEYPGSTVEEVEETLRRLPLLLGYFPLTVSTLRVAEGTALAAEGTVDGVPDLEDPFGYVVMLPPDIRRHLHLMYRYSRSSTAALPDWSPVLQFLTRWREAYDADADGVHHRYADGPEGMTVERRDALGRTSRQVLHGAAREIVLQCREPMTPEALATALPHLTPAVVSDLARELTGSGTLAWVDGVYVSLPVRYDRLPTPDPAAPESDKSRRSGIPPQPTLVSRIAEPLQASVRTLAGETVALERYRGQVVLIVNTASRCGFTDQYGALERLHRTFRDQGLRILAFPSNDFAQQEPGSAAQIREFCNVRFGLTVELFDKIHVLGRDQHPLYACLTSGRANSGMVAPVPWNFTKYVLDRRGKLVARFMPDVPPDAPALRDLIVRLLADPVPSGRPAGGTRAAGKKR